VSIKDTVRVGTGTVSMQREEEEKRAIRERSRITQPAAPCDPIAALQ